MDRMFDKTLVAQFTTISKIVVNDDFLKGISPIDPFTPIIEANKVQGDLRLSSAKNELIQLLVYFNWFYNNSFYNTPDNDQKELKQSIISKVAEVSKLLYENQLAQKAHRLEIKKFYVQVLGTMLVFVVGLLSAYASFYKKAYTNLENKLKESEGTVQMLQKENLSLKLREKSVYNSESDQPIPAINNAPNNKHELNK